MVVPSLPEAATPDAEVCTNIALKVDATRLQTLTIFVAFDSCVTNEVLVAIGADGDNDGVPHNVERLHANDYNSDLDGDGLSDYEEIYGWYKDGIGLDAKYSESSKVYTNPKIVDTDSDGLLDHSADSAKQDSDPLMWAANADTSLSICRYAASAGGNFTDITFDNEGRYTAAVTLGDRIYIDAAPTDHHAAAEYRLGTDGAYKELNKSEPIILSIGTNDIYIRCTASDMVTQKEYVLTVRSDFNTMTDFRASSPKYGEEWDGYSFKEKVFTKFCVNFNWDNYDDARAAASDGEYVLYGEKSQYLYDYSKVCTYDNASSAGYSVDNIGSKNSFFIKIPAEDLAKGTYSLDGLPKNTEYSFYLYACNGIGNGEVGYNASKLGSVHVKTGLSRYAILRFYAHYVYDKEDHDGGYKPDYWWEFGEKAHVWGSYEFFHTQHSGFGSGFGSGSVISFSKAPLWLSGLDVAKDNKLEFNDNGNRYYCFGKKEFHTGSAVPLKFSDCTKVTEYYFNRAENAKFDVTWEAWEYDRTGPHDYIGKVTTNFTYTSATDTWTCSWSSTTGQKAGSAISAGQRTGKTNGSKDDGLRWELHNTDKGEIEFHWDWGWDED